MPLPLTVARALRDGGIDAVAALNQGLAEAIAQEELAPDVLRELKHAIGRAMTAVLDETVYAVQHDWPELKPDEATWMAVAKRQAGKRAG